jgi:hypothetical protein
MSDYVPELGQAMFGNAWGQHEMSEAASGILEWVMKEIELVFWNVNGKEWDRHEDPRIPGVIFRAYYWGDDEQEAQKANFQVEGDPLEIRWYKHSCRGLSTNIEYTPEQWFDWCKRAIETVRRADIR